MAKKKKAVNRKKKTTIEPAERAPFWSLAGAVVLMLGGLFLLLGGFGTGGPLPINLFNGLYWTFGIAAFLTPLALVLLGIATFRHEEHKFSVGKAIGFLWTLVFAAAWAFAAFASHATGSWVDGHGGKVGKLVGNIGLSALNKFPAALLFLVLTALAAFFALGISPKVLTSLLNLFKKKETDEESELAALKAKAGPASLTFN